LGVECSDVTTEEENIEICLRLLGWRRHPDPELSGWYAPPDDGCFMNSAVHKQFPTFSTWGDAGLIMDALRAKGITFFKLISREWGWHLDMPESVDDDAHDTGPLAIRSAALEYIRSLP
jgi:hypothetical protein